MPLPPLTDLSAFDLDEPEFDRLLTDLCVKMGFCLSEPAAQALWGRKPTTIDEFVDALFVAECLREGTRQDA